MKNIKRMILKGISRILVLFLAICFIPIQLLACPHFDENGDMYYMFPDDDNYEITVLLYPNDYYNKVMLYDDEGKKIFEKYEIYMFQKHDMYRFDDDAPLSVEGVKNLELIGDKYKLNVPVEQAYIDFKKDFNDLTIFIYHTIKVTEITSISYDATYSNFKSLFNLQPVQYIGSPIFSLELSDTKQYIDWTKDDITKKKFHEPIDVSISLNDIELDGKNIDDFTVVRINELGGSKYSLTNIGGEYDDKENVFTFSTDEVGVYTVIEKSKKGDTSFGDIITLSEGEDVNYKKIIITVAVLITGILICSVIGKKIAKWIR